MAEIPEIKWEDIKIWSTTEMEVFEKPGVSRKVIAVTYTYKDYPPRTVWIDKDKYTKENLLKLIQEDLKAVIRGPVLPPY